MKRAVVLFSAFLLTLFFCVVFHGIALNAPVLFYEQKAPRATSECAEIRPGMSEAEAVAVVHRTVPPREERSEENLLRFIREDGSCVVELDGIGGSVVKAKADPQSRAFSWRDE